VPGSLTAEDPGVCSAELWIDDESPCDQPAICVVVFACPHCENIDRAGACGCCATDIQHAAGFFTCPHCEASPVPHECKAAVQIEWDHPTAPVTIVQEASR